MLALQNSRRDVTQGVLYAGRYCLSRGKPLNFGMNWRIDGRKGKTPTLTKQGWGTRRTGRATPSSGRTSDEVEAINEESECDGFGGVGFDLQTERAGLERDGSKFATGEDGLEPRVAGMRVGVGWFFE
jgi:hypothetical protein